MHPALAVILICLSAVNASPLLIPNTPPWQCVESCKGNPTAVNLGDSQTHIYQFNITHHISSPLNVAEKNLYVIQGKAVIIGSSNCNQQLKLKNINVYGETNDQKTTAPDFIEQLEKRVLRFGYDNGEVTGFCPSVEENPFSWNIKAAIVSALQVQPKSLSLPTKLTEEDVSGLCITEYTPQYTEGSLKGFLKTKYTAGCAKKYNFKTIFTGVDQNYPMTYSRTNSIDGSQKCEVKLEVGGPVMSSHCSEELVVRGVLDFNWNEINRVLVTTSLELVSTEASKISEYDSEPGEKFIQTTLSHHAQETTSGKTASQFSRIEQLDTEVIVDRLVNGEMRYFHLLVANLRNSTLEELTTLMNKYPDISPETKIIYEAALYAKTNASYILLQKGIKEDKFPISLLKLSLLPNPSLEEIRFLEEALRDKSFSSRATVLSILLKRFCSTHPDCQNMPEALEIASVWESYLLTNYDLGTLKDSDMPLHAIQAISNLGAVFREETLPVLVHILDPKNSLDSFLRLAAARAFRNFPADDKVDEILVNIFEDMNVDCELRIDSYRSWVRNLNAAKIFKLKKILEIEQNDQVRSYITSHLAALSRTEDPEQLNVRGLIQTYIDPQLLKSNNLLDVYKYSKYFEYMFSSHKLSGKVQASVIYGPSSTQPLSVSLNVTVNVGGRQYNVLDVSYRSTDQSFLRRLFKLFRNVDPENRIEGEFDAKESLQDKRTYLFFRMLGNEFVHLVDVEHDLLKIDELINPNGALFTMDEATSLPTSGGLMLETGFQVVSTQSASYNFGAKYGLKERWSAQALNLVLLNTPSGEFGFNTEDEGQTDFDLNVSFDANNFLLPGLKSNTTLFKYSRNVKIISPGGVLDLVEPQGELLHTNWESPYLLDDLFGLKVSKSRNCYARIDENLCTHVSLVADRFDGLLLHSSIRSPSDVSITIARPKGETDISKIYPLFQLLVQDKQNGIAAKLITPWKNNYTFTSEITDAANIYEMQLGKWRAVLNDTKITFWQRELNFFTTGGIQLTAAFDYDSSAHSYRLEVDSSGKIMPFKIKSISKGFNILNSMVHSTSLFSDSFGNLTFTWDRDYSMRDNGNKSNSTLKTSLIYHKPDGKETGVEFGVSNEGVEHNTSMYTSETRAWLQSSSAPSLNCDFFVNQTIKHGGFGKSKQLYDILFSMPLKGIGLRTELKWDLDHSHYIYDVIFRTSLRTSFDAPNRFFELMLTTSDSQWVLVSKLDASATHRYSLSSIYILKENLSVKIDYPQNQTVIFQTKILPVYNGSIANIVIDPMVYVNSKKRFSMRLNASADISMEDIALEYHAYTHNEENITLLVKIEAECFRKNLLRATLDIDLPFISDEASFTAAYILTDAKGNLHTQSHAIFGKIHRVGLKMNQIIDLPWINLLDTNITFYGLNPVSKHSMDLLTINRVRANDGSMRNKFHFDGKDWLEILAKTSTTETLPLTMTASEMYSITPKIENPYLTGLFFKRTTESSMTPTEFKWKQFGEYNLHKGHGPGMPFRFGVEYTHEPDFKKGLVNVFVEDSNFGLLTDFELFEALYEYELTEAKAENEYAWSNTNGKNGTSTTSEAESDDRHDRNDEKDNDPDGNIDHERVVNTDEEGDKSGDDNEDNNENENNQLNFSKIKNMVTNKLVLDSMVMVNWRRSLARGVVGTHGTLKANISTDLSACSAELKTELVDDLQSKVFILFDWLRDGNYLAVTTASRLEDKIIHNAQLKSRNGLQELNITAVIPQLNVAVNVDSKVKLPSQLTDPVTLDVRWNSTSEYAQTGSILYSHALFGHAKFVRGKIDYNERNLALIDITANNLDARYKFRMNSEAHIFPIDFQTRLNLSNSDNPWHRLDVRLNLANHLFDADLSDLRWYIAENGLKFSSQLKLQSTLLGRSEAELNSSMSFTPGFMPVIDIATVCKHENKTFLRNVFSLNETNSPKVDIYANFERPLLGFNEVEYYLWSPRMKDKFIFNNRFQSRPILLNYDIKAILEENILVNPLRLWRYSSRKQLFDVALKITDSAHKNHSASFVWTLNRKLRRLPYSFTLKANIDSDLLYNGSIEASTSHVFGYHPSLEGKILAGNIGPLLFDLKCSSSHLEPNCSVSMKNAENQAFKRMLFQFGSTKDRHYTMGLNVNDEHRLEVVYSPWDENMLKTQLILNKALLFNSTIKATTQRNNTNWGLAIKCLSTIYLAEDRTPQTVIMNFTLKGGDSGVEAKAGVQFFKLNARKVSFVFSPETISFNINFEALASMNFRYNRRYHVMELKSQLYPSHNVKFESNLFYLIYAAFNGSISFIPPNRFYFVSICENTVTLELNQALTVNLFCELKDLPQPLVFRTGYLWIDKPLEQRLRLEFEIDEPEDCEFMVEAGLLRDVSESARFSLLAAISKEHSIPKSLGNFTVGWRTNGHVLETRLNLKSKQNLDTSLTIDSTDGSDKVTVIVLSPPGLELPSFNVTTTQTHWPKPRMPFEIVYQSEFRNSRIGLELADEQDVFEFSWNKLTQGTLLVTLKPGQLVIDTPGRVFILGFEHSPFWNVSLQTQWKGGQDPAKNAFVQLSGNPNFQVQLKSNLLNEPLSTHLNAAPNRLTWRLQQGTFELPIATIYEVDFNQDYSKYPRMDTYLALRCGNKTVDLDTIFVTNASIYQLDTNITVDEAREILKMQYIPFESFYLKLNNSTIVSMNTSFHTEIRTTEFAVDWPKPSVSLHGNLYFTKYPLDLYLRLAGKYKEGLLRAQMSDIFNAAGEISTASPNKEPVTYIKLMSFLNESNIYHLQTLWKEGAYTYLVSSVVDQLDLPGTWGYFKEGMSKLVEDNFQILRSLVNETALVTVVNSVTDDFNLAVNSLTDGQVNGSGLLRRLSFANLPIYLDLFEDKMVLLVKDIFMPKVDGQVLNRVLRTAVYVWGDCRRMFTSFARTILDPIDVVFVSLREKLDSLWISLSNWDGWLTLWYLPRQLWSKIKAEDPDFAEALESPIKILDSIYVDIREMINRLVENAYAFTSYLVENEWSFDWSQPSIWRMLRAYFRPEATSFVANWEDFDTNSTVYLPKPVREIVSAVAAQLFKRTYKEADPLEHSLAIADIQDIATLQNTIRNFRPYWEHPVGNSSEVLGEKGTRANAFPDV